MARIVLHGSVPDPPNAFSWDEFTRAIDALMTSYFHKADAGSVAFSRVSFAGVELKAGTLIFVDGRLVAFTEARAVTLPSLAPTAAYSIFATGTGDLVATLEGASPFGYPASSLRKIGGFRTAADSSIRANSLWDLASWRDLADAIDASEQAVAKAAEVAANTATVSAKAAEVEADTATVSAKAAEVAANTATVSARAAEVEADTATASTAAATATSKAIAASGYADTAAASAAISSGLNYVVSIYHSAGIKLGTYYAARSAATAGIHAYVAAEVVAGAAGSSVSFYIAVGGNAATGLLTAVYGAPLLVTNLGVSVQQGQRVDIVVVGVAGSVTEFAAQLSKTGG